jgi:elongation factor Ts
MADISAQVVKELRERTGAGMMDCKKALKENDGDMTKATEWLRQKGITSADKKAGRVAAEGLVGSYIKPGGQVGVLVEVNCETDFVARREEFQKLVQNIAMQAAESSDVQSLMTQQYINNQDITVEEFVKETIAQIGENIQVRRSARFMLMKE